MPKKIWICIWILIVLAVALYGCCQITSFDDDVLRVCVNDISGNSEVVLIRNQDLPEGDYRWSIEYKSASSIEVIASAPTYFDYQHEPYIIFDSVILDAASEGSAAEGSFSVDDNYWSGFVTIYSEDGSDILIDNFELVSIGRVYRDGAFCLALFLLGMAVLMAAGVLILLKPQNGMGEFSLFAGVVLIVALSSFLWLKEGYPAGDDSIFHLRRIQGLAESIGRGEFPQRMNTVFNARYGYLNPVMYPELFLYLPALLVVGGMSGLGAMKLFYIVINIATVLIARWSFGAIAKDRRVGLLVASVYTLAFYRLNNMYLRSSLGETLFMAFLPIAIYGLYSVMMEEKKRWGILALGVGCIVQSHILGIALTVIMLALLFIAMGVDRMSQKRFSADTLIALVKAVTSVLLLNAWFLGPFIFYYITQDFAMFDKGTMTSWFFEHQITIGKLLSPTVVERQIVYNMGPLLLVATIVTVAFCVVKAFASREDRFMACSMVVLIGFFVVLCTDLVPWELLNEISVFSAMMRTVQFAFRFHGLLIAIVCFSLALFFPKVESKNVWAIIAISGIVLSVYNCWDFYNNSSAGLKWSKYISEYYDAPSEYLPQGASFSGELFSGQPVAVSDNIEITYYHKEGHRITLSYNDPYSIGGLVKLPLIYYYGYSVVDEVGEPLPISTNENGCIVCLLPEGKDCGEVNIKFNGIAPIFAVPAVISVLSGSSMAIWVVKKR